MSITKACTANYGARSNAEKFISSVQSDSVSCFVYEYNSCRLLSCVNRKGTNKLYSRTSVNKNQSLLEMIKGENGTLYYR